MFARALNQQLSLILSDLVFTVQGSISSRGFSLLLFRDLPLVLEALYLPLVNPLEGAELEWQPRPFFFSAKHVGEVAGTQMVSYPVAQPIILLKEALPFPCEPGH